MKKSQALAALAVAYLFLTAAAVWEFGSYGLAGAGFAAMVALAFMKTEE